MCLRVTECLCLLLWTWSYSFGRSFTLCNGDQLLYMALPLAISAFGTTAIELHENNNLVPKIDCSKPKRRKQPTKPTGNIEDITEEMIDAHTLYTDTHDVENFVSDLKVRSAALNWCEIQLRSGCDMIYPLGIAFNAAIVPISFMVKDVAQLWYNERSHYDVRKPVLENVILSQHGAYEVIHYANMVADYPGRQLGCCRVPCKNGLCYAYGCAYGPHGAGYWTLAKPESTLNGSDDDKESTVQQNFINETTIHQPYIGFTFFSPEDVRNAIISSPKINIIRRIRHEELATTGCSANVAGNGPEKAQSPFLYSCQVNNQGHWDDLLNRAVDSETNALFQPYPVVVGSCTDATLSVPPPLYLYCPPNCLNDTQAQDTFKIVDAGKSVCGKAASISNIEKLKEEPDGTIGKLYHVRSFSGEELQLVKNGPLTHNTCSATQYSFADCSNNLNACLLSMQISSKDQPWVFASIDTMAHDAIGHHLLILRNSLCSFADLSVSLLSVKGSREGQLALIGNYLSPTSFIALDFSFNDGIATLLKCTGQSCIRAARLFIGNPKEKIFTLALQMEHSGKFKAVINKEIIGVIEKDNSFPPIGFYGIAVSGTSMLAAIEDVTLLPLISVTDTTHPFELTQDSLLPLWPFKTATIISKP